MLHCVEPSASAATLSALLRCLRDMMKVAVMLLALQFVGDCKRHWQAKQSADLPLRNNMRKTVIYCGKQ